MVFSTDQIFINSLQQNTPTTDTAEPFKHSVKILKPEEKSSAEGLDFLDKNYFHFIRTTVKMGRNNVFCWKKHVASSWNFQKLAYEFKFVSP